MWICDPLSGAPPLSSPLHPSRWQRLHTAFSHAFPKSRYVDSIRLTSHNGEFVQQGAPHYLNPSVALPLFQICGLDWHGLPCVSFRDGQKVNSSAPFEVHETWLWSIDAKSPLKSPKMSPLVRHHRWVSVQPLSQFGATDRLKSEEVNVCKPSTFICFVQGCMHSAFCLLWIIN